MKISEYKQMMAYLTRPKSKGGEVKVRKPNAVPPKTKTIQKFSKGGATEKPYGKVLIKKVSKKPTQLELPLDKPEEPKPNVIPLNPKPDSPFGTPGGWMSEAADVELKKDTRKDETLAEYMARKEEEYQKKLFKDAMSKGLGTLL
jgi:hypothetical protein